MRMGHIVVSPIGPDRGTCTVEAEAWNPTGATTNQTALVRPINQQPLDLSMNPSGCWCKDSRLRTFPRRCANVLGWIIPGVIMAMLPKCPMCLAAYIAIWSGVGISLSAATHLRMSLLVLSVGLALFMAARKTSRLIHKFGR